ncbi:MAG: MerR family transcriptional regulator [Sarcina sp.]
MEYTIKKLAELAGISTRTLRYYDEINLLKPKRINSSGYRIYGQTEIDILEEIMLYKEMEIPLEYIKKMLLANDYKRTECLKIHYRQLLEKKKHIENLIVAIELTIANDKGEINMSNKEKFEVFKKSKIDENEKLYGKEARNLYGDESVDDSNRKFLNLEQNDFDKMNMIEEKLFLLLEEVNKNKDINSAKAKEIFNLHKEWLSFRMKYNKEVHLGIVKMYTLDERFTKYYDEKSGIGATKILENIVEKYIYE